MDKMVELFCTYDEVEAQIVKDMLESEGIHVMVKSMKINPYPVNVGKMGEIKLMVTKEDRKRAETILKDIKENTDTEPDIDH